ncbi:MAG: radical SAM protein [Candidatus Omnitrophica bacterium]|nr:radical SAM protein [Candidatus Omnitrophota bacterium]
MKHYIIPFFILHKGCPNECVFCDQKKITARESIKPEDIPIEIEKYLETMPRDGARIEVGFFGGTFTALAKEDQASYLDKVQKYVIDGRVHGIRLSTRPDFINEDILDFLKARKVSCIELGVQSMSDKVLVAAKRGHTARDVEKASKMIIDKGFTLGHQIMLGLPLSTEEDEYFTARRAKELGAAEVRIYPVLVIKNTELADMWSNDQYSPLSEAEAIKRAANLIVYFEANDIKVIRCGLHPSEGLLSGSDLLDGPFSPTFRLKVESLIFRRMMEYLFRTVKGNLLEIVFNPQDEAAFFGFGRENLALIKKIGKYKKDEKVKRGSLRAVAKEGAVEVTRKELVNSE